MAWDPSADRAPLPAPGAAGDAWTLGVDRIACDGYGTCADLLPELIAPDEWGYPILRPGPVPDVLLEHARTAVDACPVLALRLARVGRASVSPASSEAPRPVPPRMSWAPARPNDR